MTRRQRRRCINLIRRIRNQCGHEAAARIFQSVYCRHMYWNYETNRLTGLFLEDTRGRGIVIDL